MEFVALYHGETENLVVYGTSKPYSYPLQKVTLITIVLLPLEAGCGGD